MKETRKTPPISKAQREIMEIVWQRGEVGVGQVWRTLAARRPVTRNTVLTVITRLAAKGWLVPRREGNAFRYTAAFPKETARADEVRRLVDTVFDGSAEGLVMTLLECGGLTPQESKRIREMILASQRKARKGNK
jgi:predicted transcriptional regulator